MGTPAVLRRTLSCVLFGAVAVAAMQAGCGDSSRSRFSNGSGPGSDGTSGGVAPGFGAGDASGGTSGNSNAASVLDVTPATVTINVTITDGVVSASTQSFVASYNGAPVPATWLFDRGELGEIAASGVFTANGKNVGEGTVTARYGAREGTAKLKVVVAATQNGAPAGAGATAGGAGGLGGVGGEPLGPAVESAVITKLRAQSNPPASPQELGFLYPYDLTVWPRGLLPPLLMWQTNKEASAVYVRLSQGNYSFEGTYMLTQHPSESAARKRVRLDETPWRTATSGNTGDDLKLEVKIYSSADDKVYGPITRTWKVAPGVLKGTVYYNSYDSLITTGGGTETGGIIKIKPRSPDPELAVPSMSGKCHACHVVSSDGSTLFVQDGTASAVPCRGDDHYCNGGSYDLRQPSPPRTSYMGGDLAAHNRKFVWAAPYPDGSFALASYGYAREAYTEGPSKLFDRASGAEVVVANVSQVTSAVTPSFSPDGRKVAFNFWAGPGAAGVSAGEGHSLAVFDFDCGAPAGSITCAAGTTPAFSGLRQIYKDETRWPGWPSFVPDGKAVVFHNTLEGADVGSGKECRPSIVNPPPNTTNCQLTTWRPNANGATGATAELWIAKDGAAQDARRLDALNGFGPGGVSYLPTAGNHPDDTKLNYMPTVNPVASGGYYWVVFASRRLYGNVLTGEPHAWGGPQKKLWVAAIDIDNPTPGADPSHPAFYLPGQELNAGNSRGFWVVDPCKQGGQTCETGDECCNGFCRKDSNGALVCMDKPSGQCSQEFEKCTVDADCCDPKFKCIAGKCTRPDPVVK